MAGLCVPLSTLRHAPRGAPRMTRGQHDSLFLCCEGLAPFTPCRFYRRTRMKAQNRRQRTTQTNNSSFPSFPSPSLIEKQEGRKEFLVFIGVLLLLNRRTSLLPSISATPAHPNHRIAFTGAAGCPFTARTESHRATPRAGIKKGLTALVFMLWSAQSSRVASRLTLELTHDDGAGRDQGFDVIRPELQHLAPLRCQLGPVVNTANPDHRVV